MRHLLGFKSKKQGEAQGWNMVPAGSWRQPAQPPGSRRGRTGREQSLEPPASGSAAPSEGTGAVPASGWSHLGDETGGPGWVAVLPPSAPCSRATHLPAASHLLSMSLSFLICEIQSRKPPPRGARGRGGVGKNKCPTRSVLHAGEHHPPSQAGPWADLQASGARGGEALAGWEGAGDWVWLGQERGR